MKFSTILAFALGPISNAILSLIYVPVSAWFFGSVEIGKIALFQVVISLTCLIYTLGLDQAYVREYYDSNNKTTLFIHTLGPALLLLLLSILACKISNFSLDIIIFEVEDRFISNAVFICIFCTLLSRFFSLILRMEEKGLLFSLGQIIGKAVLLIIIIFFITTNANNDLTNLLTAHMVSMIMVCLFFIWNGRNQLLMRSIPNLDWQKLKELLRFGLPLIVGGFAFWGLTAMDKVLIKKLSNFHELGIYSIAVSFAAFGVIIQNIFTTVWAPFIYKLNRDGLDPKLLYKSTRYLTLITVVLFCIAGLLSWIVPLFLPKDFNEVQYILVACLGYPLFYSLSETTVVGISITKRTKLLMLATVLACATNFIGNYMLIPLFGASGAAVSTCFSFLVLLVLRTEFAIYTWIPIPRRTLYAYCLLMTLGASAFCIYGKSYKLFFTVFWIAMLVGCSITFRHEIARVFIFLVSRFSGLLRSSKV